MPRTNPFERDLDRNAANYTPLTPMSLIARAAYTYPQHLAVVHGDRRYSWAETYARCRRLASALVRAGIGVGDTVALMAANTPEMVEAHFGVPMAGGVLNTLNTRLDAEAIAFMLEHGGAKVVITDTEYAPIVEKALAQIAGKPLVIDIADALGPGGKLLGRADYEAFIAEGDPEFAWQHPTDEWNAISLNYTSGTTGNPKGVVYHYRGAYLNALGEVIETRLTRERVPVDAADVPLQRLVLHLGGDRRRRPPRVPAPGGPGPRLGADRRRGRHASARRPAPRRAAPRSGRPGR